MKKQKTAMELLKEDLIDCKKLSIENLSEVSNKTIRDATLKLVTNIFSLIIERIDSELLTLERQQIESEITIRNIKDSWSREEVESKIKEFYEEYKFSGINVNKWISEKL